MKSHHVRYELAGVVVSAARHALILGLVGLAGLGVPAGATAQGAQNRPPPCASEEYRQFDFWAGDWDVYNPAGKIVGTNTITPMFGGCVLREHWEGGGGNIGESYNMYDRGTGQWHQTWVDNGGLLLKLDGKLEDGSMVLHGELIGRDGNKSLQRVTWTPGDDGSVRQHWESSADEGATWSTQFDGKYVRKEAEG